MKRWLPLLKAARYSLFFLAAAWLLGLGLILGGIYLGDYMRGGFSSIRQQLDAQNNHLQMRQQDLHYLKQQIGPFQSLVQQGLLASPDREEWGRQVLASRERLGLPETLSYTIKPPVSLASLNRLGVPQDSAMSSETPASDENSTLAYDLDLELREIHEEELLRLLQDLRAHIRKPFRVQSCRLAAPVQEGLNVQCTLRFFSLPALPDQERQALLSALPSHSEMNEQPLAQADQAPISLATLFYTQGQRKAIVLARRAEGGDMVPTAFNVSGVVRRAGGKSTLWINGRPLAEGQSPEGVSISRGDLRNPAKLQIEGKTVQVGESLDLLSGQRREVLPPGALHIHPPKKAD